MKKSMFLLGLVFLLVFSITGLAADFSEETHESGSLDIEQPEKEYFSDYNTTFYISVLDEGVATNNSVGCNYTLYDTEEQLLHEEMDFSKSSNRFYVNIQGSELNTEGEHYYDIHCNTNSSYGFLRDNIVFVNSPATRTFLSDSIVSFILASVFFTGLMFYFAYKLEEKHSLLRIVTILFGVLGLLVIVSITTGNIFTSNYLLMYVVYGYFGIFMFYFIIYLIWWLATSFPEIMRIRR